MSIMCGSLHHTRNLPSPTRSAETWDTTGRNCHNLRGMQDLLVSVVAVIGAAALGLWLQNLGFSNAAWLFVALLCGVIIAINAVGISNLRAFATDAPIRASVLGFVVIGVLGIVGWRVYTEKTSPVDASSVRTSAQESEPQLIHALAFHMLRAPNVRADGAPIQLDFILRNATRPPDEIHNIFGELWLDSEFVVSFTEQPSRGTPGSGRLEWDIRIPVFPKEGVFKATSIRLRVPPQGKETLVGAQFVSKQTDRQEYMWSIVNDGTAINVSTRKDANKSTQ
jgi:hypothetical protein